MKLNYLVLVVAFATGLAYTGPPNCTDRRHPSTIPIVELDDRIPVHVAYVEKTLREMCKCPCHCRFKLKKNVTASAVMCPPTSIDYLPYAIEEPSTTFSELFQTKVFENSGLGIGHKKDLYPEDVEEIEEKVEIDDKRRLSEMRPPPEEYMPTQSVCCNREQSIKSTSRMIKSLLRLSEDTSSQKDSNIFCDNQRKSLSRIREQIKSASPCCDQKAELRKDENLSDDMTLGNSDPVYFFRKVRDAPNFDLIEEAEVFSAVKNCCYFKQHDSGSEIKKFEGKKEPLRFDDSFLRGARFDLRGKVDPAMFNTSKYGRFPIVRLSRSISMELAARNNDAQQLKDETRELQYDTIEIKDESKKPDNYKELIINTEELNDEEKELIGNTSKLNHGINERRESIINRKELIDDKKDLKVNTKELKTDEMDIRSTIKRSPRAIPMITKSVRRKTRAIDVVVEVAKPKLYTPNLCQRKSNEIDSIKETQIKWSEEKGFKSTTSTKTSYGKSNLQETVLFRDTNVEPAIRIKKYIK